MKLIWHLARKDLVHLRWPAAGFVALQIATLLLAWILRDEAFGRYPTDAVWGTHLTAAIIVGVFAYLLTGTLLQDDPLASSQAFWATRPISRARLLAAKVVAVAGLFWFLPVVIKTPWWLLNHYGLRELGWAAIESVIVSAAVTIPAFLLASLTKDLAQFYRWTFGALVVGALGCLALGIGVEASGGSLLQTSWRAMFGAGVAVCVVAAANQIFTRRRIRSLVVVGVGLPLVVVTFTAWDKRPAFAPARIEAVGSEVAMRDVRIRTTLGAPAIELTLGPAATSGDWFASITSLGGTLRSAGEEISVDWSGWELEPAAVIERIANHGTRGGPVASRVPLTLTAAQIERLQAEPEGARLSAKGELWRGEDAVELPLRIDATVWQGTRRLWIKDIYRAVRNETRLIRPLFSRHVTIMKRTSHYGEALEIRLSEVVPLLAADGAQIVIENNGVLAGAENFYLLINRRRNEIIRLPMRSISSVRAGTVGINEITLVLEQTTMDEDAFTMWLAEASLVKIVLRRIGTFSTVAEILRKEAIR